jgi:hypothetical protein
MTGALVDYDHWIIPNQNLFFGRVLRKALAVSLRRRDDNAVFHVTAPCILQLPDGLIHIVGTKRRTQHRHLGRYPEL